VKHKKKTAQELLNDAVRAWERLPSRERLSLAEFLEEDAREVLSIFPEPWDRAWARKCRRAAKMIRALDVVLRRSARPSRRRSTIPRAGGSSA